MEDSDSETEGQLLIDESEETLKKTRRGRKRGGISSNANNKKNLKLVVKTGKAQKKNNESSAEVACTEESKVRGTRTSSRVRNRVRKHSPSPISKKKEPPRKKLKVKIKNMRRLKKVPASNINAKAMQPEKPAKLDDGNVDIEYVSDDEQLDIQYTSTMIDKTPVDTSKRGAKKFRKTGIKLKLSLGKVLSSKVADSIIEEAAIKNILSDVVHSQKSHEVKENLVKPLIISTRQFSNETKEKNEKCDINSSVPDMPSLSECSSIDKSIAGDSQYYSSAPEGHKPVTLRLSSLTDESVCNDKSIDSESQYYSSTPEGHKPLTLRLSVGKPNLVHKPASEAKGLGHSSPKVFPNIRRSWSTATMKGMEGAEVSSGISKQPTTSANHNNENQSKTADKTSSPSQYSSAKPFFSIGLQSLLDVVSVELNEQKKSDYSSTIGNLSQAKTIPALTTSPLKQTKVKNKHSPAIEKNISEHEGQLPSLTFPKPTLHFSTKKRARSKSVTPNVGSQPAIVYFPENPLAELEQSHTEEILASSNCILTDKERRRRDKKKKLTSDFVDPDVVIKDEIDIMRKPKKKLVVHMNSQINKTGGLSLVMPQMTSTLKDSEKANVLKIGSTCNLPSKLSVPKKPRKGMATAKQRLANKLKLGRTHAF